MPDYENAKIYTIRCKTDENLIYVGSTTQTLSQRWTNILRSANALRTVSGARSQNSCVC